MIQRVKVASVRVSGNEVARIGSGLLVLVGFSKTDSEEVVQWMGRKVPVLRLFNDEDGKMNLDVEEAQGKILVVSQFTLYGDCNKGKRPSFDKSAPADMAEILYDRFIEILQAHTTCGVEMGVFQAHMEVGFVNDGPVTVILDKDTA